jgi:polyphosphate glucokinase
MHTLCIDIGGTGLKAMVLGPTGEPTSDRTRVATPQPATPDAVLAAIELMVAPLGAFDRIAVGFPGVVVDGVTRTAPNLDPAWTAFPLAAELERRTGKPARVANDAGVQGLAVIEGKGVEVVITLGTGMGFALYIDGRYVPNIEMAHHPFMKGQTYEERVGEAARVEIGNRRWRGRVAKVLAQLDPIFNYRQLYLGGGNAQRIEPSSLPANVKIVSNVAGLLGGHKLWT